MTAKYIDPNLPAMIRNLYRDDLRERSIQNMLNLAGDLIQELIDLRASTEEVKAQAWDEGAMAAANAIAEESDSFCYTAPHNPYRKDMQ